VRAGAVRGRPLVYQLKREAGAFATELRMPDALFARWCLPLDGG
jgi:hypothetical protein